MIRPAPRRIALALMLSLAIGGTIAAPAGPAIAAQIKYVVNGVPVTTYDIDKRLAFLKLQRRAGANRAMAEQDMIDQALRAVELQRLRINISDKAVEQAYANFAQNNKMTTKQMDQVLGQMGVTAGHFKEFLRVQMGWNQALGARYRATGKVSESDVVQRMLQQGGNKPSATEYMLQQVIFVVPANQRGSRLAQRKREAEAMRNRFSGCSETRNFVKGLIDVTVRDLGRVLEPELPPDWADLIKAIKPGQATRVRETERGVEFIGICSSREVSDDRVAQIVFQNSGATEEKAEELSKQYLSELKEKARIQQR